MPITRDQLESVSRELMTGLDAILTKKFGERIGITLLLSPFGDDLEAPIAYISNVTREDMIKTVEIWLANAKTRITDPRGPKAEG